jgi:uncharacterized membrane protein
MAYFATQMHQGALEQLPENATTISKYPSRLVSSSSTCESTRTDESQGMMLHLYTILPAALLVILQFIPVIRHKLILFHRMNGYIVVLLSLISNAGTIIITRHAFGGDFSTQTWTGAMVILTTLGYIMAWVNIKLLQIDQHRAWMLRTWAWVCVCVSRLKPSTYRSRAVLNHHHYPHHHDHLSSDHQYE